MGGSVYTWELRNLAPINLEPSSPQVSSLVPRLAVSFYPKGDTQPNSLKTFSNWAEVSHWLSELHDPQAIADEPLAAKTRALTANATTELDKIRAIGRFVQSIKYISIDIGVSRGGGMRPHSAAQVFAKSYGDCKDKANLMRAMLKGGKHHLIPGGHICRRRRLRARGMALAAPVQPLHHRHQSRR